jgi:hypothetical protein
MAAGLYFVKGVNEVPCPPISKTDLVTLIPVPIETIIMADCLSFLYSG